MSRDYELVERVDQWGGGIPAVEGQPSGVVGGLAASRSEGTEPAGYGNGVVLLSVAVRPTDSLSCHGATTTRPTWAVMDAGAIVGGTRERAAHDEPPRGGECSHVLGHAVPLTSRERSRRR